MFTSRDPLDSVNGTAVVGNAYHYGNNNPLSNMDPTGTTSKDSVKNTAAGIKIPNPSIYETWKTGWDATPRPFKIAGGTFIVVGAVLLCIAACGPAAVAAAGPGVIIAEHEAEQVIEATGGSGTIGNNGGAASTATDAATEAVSDPAPQYTPSGAPDRSSAVYINGVDAEGNVATYGSRPGGMLAEDVAQAANPGDPMSRPFGWRTNPGEEVPTWQPINVCTTCQVKYPPSLFPSGTGFDLGGTWSSH